jgi:predicted Rossmann fold flavoprotein
MKGVEALKIEMGEPISTIITNKGSFLGKNILIATGSNRDMWNLIQNLGHTIIEPVPSLFALNTPESSFNQLSGLSLQEAALSYKSHKFQGPLLFTHFGLSGPTALKLSSFAARDFSETSYEATIFIDFLPKHSEQMILDELHIQGPTLNQVHLGLPKRLWEHLLTQHGIDRFKPLAQISKQTKLSLVTALKKTPVLMKGKTTHKDEFVTAGGVDLNEVNFSNMESKLHKHLYFAGEVLNIDAVTGGFNFQAAWSTGYLVALDASKKLSSF